MKYLIFGATGILGSELKSRLGSISEIDLIISSHSTINKVSFGDGRSIESLVSKTCPDVVINCAALTNVDFCEKNPIEAFKINAKGVEEISEAMGLYCPNSKLIHISTDHFYNDDFYSKESDAQPMNYYAYSKLLGEKLIKFKNSLVLRTNFFGKSNVDKLSFSDWIVNSIEKKDEITLFDDVYFNPLSLPTLCSIILEISKSERYGTYNLGSLNGLSKYDFGIELAKYSGFNVKKIKKGKISNSSLSAKRPKNMTMNVLKFSEKFNINLPKFEEEIKMVSKIYRG